MRIDPAQRFSCSQCGRCCHNFDVVVSAGEIDLYRKRDAGAWFTESDGAAANRDPFEPIPGAPALQRIRKRSDGACGFLSADNRCRIHEELGAAKKPLTCRVYPYAFHRAPDGIVVTASFGCPTIVANEGVPIALGAPRTAIESLAKEWLDAYPATARARELVAGRSIDARTTRVLRENLLVMLKHESDDIRSNIARMAHALDDLTRSRVLALGETEFAEYVALTLPYAAKQANPPAAREAGAIARLLQYGFLYLVCAIRQSFERSGQSAWHLRLVRLQMLLHFHGLSTRVVRVNVGAIKRHPIDINSQEIRPIVFHYLRSTLETLGAQDRPILDDLAIAVSYLNSACGLAAMNADAAGTNVDRNTFVTALTEASDVAHAHNKLLDWILVRFSGRTEALWKLAAKVC